MPHYNASQSGDTLCTFFSPNFNFVTHSNYLKLAEGGTGLVFEPISHKKVRMLCNLLLHVHLSQSSYAILLNHLISDPLFMMLSQSIELNLLFYFVNFSCKLT